MAVPPTYVDLGKSAKDVFTKGYGEHLSTSTHYPSTQPWLLSCREWGMDFSLVLYLFGEPSSLDWLSLGSVLTGRHRCTETVSLRLYYGDSFVNGPWIALGVSHSTFLGKGGTAQWTSTLIPRGGWEASWGCEPWLTPGMTMYSLLAYKPHQINTLTRSVNVI